MRCCPSCYLLCHCTLPPIMLPSHRHVLLLVVLSVTLLCAAAPSCCCALMPIMPLVVPVHAAAHRTVCLSHCHALLPIMPPVILLHAVAVMLPVVLPCAAACHITYRTGVHCCLLCHLSCCSTLLVLGCPCGVKKAGTRL